MIKNINPLGLFDNHFLFEKLTKLGYQLQKPVDYNDWKVFESPISEASKDEVRNKFKGGRPPSYKLMLFKSMLIHSLYKLSDDQLEYQINDRANFKRFPRLKKTNKVSDSKTFWSFREQLIEKNVIQGLFKTFLYRRVSSPTETLNADQYD